ncbi:hypothetical protein ACFLVO_04950 [Chloroflexota bacterium]
MHSIFIIIGIIVLGIILSLIYIPRITQPRRLDSFSKFLLTLLATLAGVFLAFQISSYQDTQDEKDFLVALLEQSASELQSEVEYIQVNYLSFIEDERDIAEFEQFINSHPMGGIVSLDILLNSTLLPRFASSSSGEIRVVKRDLETMRATIKLTSIAPRTRLELIQPYIQQMSYMRELLLTEAAYIQGDISDEEAEEEYNRLKIRLISSVLLN